MKKFVSLLLLLTMVLALFCGAAFADGARSADVVILFTSDVHCGIDQGFGYAGLQGIRERINPYKGTVKVSSRPGGGAKVTVSMFETRQNGS